MASTLHDLTIFNINLEHGGKQEWLPEIPEDTGEGAVTRFTDDKTARKLLRLVGNSAVEVLCARAKENSYYSDFQRELRRIRHINSQATARAANSRLLKLYEWETSENGENAGSDYYSAAFLTDWLLWTYNGGYVDVAFEDVAGRYSTVVGTVSMSTARQKLVCQLLEELKKIEGEAKS